MIPGIESLRDVTPPPSLIPRVMRAVAEPAPFSFWSWMRGRRRFELRFSPLGALAVTAAVAVGMLFLKPIQPPVASVQETVLVHFVLLAPGARSVAVAGDFNDWNPGKGVLADSDGKGRFAATLNVPRGSHGYMFLVDGRWVTDPAAGEVRPDGFGNTNAILRI